MGFEGAKFKGSPHSSYATDSDSTRVTLGKMVTRLVDAIRVTVNDSRLESESFLQNI